ncbi:TonB-dependent receptor [Biformimicrobium ophioploci]|uniref:TonB-dependent receptor n=1 Tax=Biformimicrobium ophioploci TaxID=3036711 RepID=A0ABQ6LZQ0_9GAMM|nr:TonB-dependent receptor [Microbulbifer sp. NKW57]GMG87555.1 TonB-dependent receptor [Microbulbifer sp. NKW57]
MSSSKHFSLQPIAAAIGLSMISVAASAQSADAPAGLEEITVTAQKRAQNMQEVPVAVTAFGSDDLEQAGVETIADLERISPNTQLRASRATNTTLTAYIRGIGQNDPLWGFEPGVGLYIDDVYFARPQGAMLDVYDIERIEVLRGPQGSLYGKNTIGGAIKYVTKRMSGDAEMDLGVSVGSYNQRDITAAGKLPLIEDKLYVGATVASFNRDGFGTNNYTGAENYNKDITAARVSMEFTPTEELFIRLAADKTEDDSNNRHGSRLTTSLQTGEAPQDPFDSSAGAGDKQKVENTGTNLTVEWALSDNITVKSVSAWREGSTEGFIDFDGTQVNTFDAPVMYEDDQFTQELQFNYTNDRLALVGGFFYMDGYAAGAFDVIAGAALGGPAQEPQNAIAPTFVAATEGTADTESRAVYLQANYDLTDKATLTLGGRYTKDEKSATVYKARLFTDGSAGGASALFGGGDLLVLGVQSDFEEGGDWSKFNPKVGIDYQINDDTMVYASYAEGFKSGGINMRADVSASPAGFSHVFEPEDAASFELGLKTEMLDNRVRMNAAVFSTDYENVQITQTALIGTNFVPVVATDNVQSINGVELEVTAALTDSLTAVANMGYADASWDKFLDGAGMDVSDDRSVSNVPELSGMVGFTYETTMAGGSLILGGNLSYTDEIAMEVAVPNQPIDEDSYTLANVDVTWYSADEHWSVGLHGKNLTDEAYRVAGYNFPAFLGDDEILGFYGAPRTFTASVSYKF